MPLPQLVFSCLFLVVVVADSVGGTNYASSVEQTRQEYAERLAGAEAGSDCAGAECGGIASPTYVAYPILFLFVSLLIGCAVRFTLESVKSKFNFNVLYSVCKPTQDMRSFSYLDHIIVLVLQVGHYIMQNVNILRRHHGVVLE